MSKESLILLGGGGHCKACIDVIEKEDKYKIAGIIDMKERIGEKILNYSIIGCDDELELLSKSYNNFFITIGQIKPTDKRINIFQKLRELNLNIPIIISPMAYVSRYANIDSGTIIMHQAIVNAGAAIGSNCIINTKALIEHDVVIQDHCHISTGAIVNGGVRIGANTFFGSGAVSKEYIEIPARSFIKANSIVK